VGLEEPLGFVAVVGLEAGLLSGRFVFEVVNASGALNQTELLLHCFTHGCECEAVGIGLRKADFWCANSLISLGIRHFC
jgi:hypothetical protein